ncbi:MAG TPA: sodium-dependent transporter [Phycisphaerales bacterium]|nr:sodium-dependent transporter [Phycisphaerales bacterium]
MEVCVKELLEEQRETWGSRGGFVLAAVGSAVGLGNLWGFPYKLYSYGGGAFLVPYIIAMFCIGIPMLILEFSLGHFTQRAAPDAFRRCNRKLEFVGWWGIILGFVIVTYYPVILAYCFSYIKYSVDGIIHHGGALPWGGTGLAGVENAEKFFDNYLTGGDTAGPFQLHILIPLIIAWVAMYFCIFKGVKLVGKIVWLTVPLPWIMLCILAIRGLTLPGSMKGLVYYLDPVWSELAKPTTWRFAFGQVFFSLSLAFGVMLTYASFLHRKSDINNNAAIIGIADFATSFIAGIAIFATIGGMAYISGQSGNPVAVDQVIKGGPGLAFVAFPYALAQLPGAAWWSLIFFFTLVTLGIDSAFSITESVLAGLVDKTGWRRSIVLPAMSLVGLAFGLVYVTKGGINWIGAIDGFINGTWGIAFLGLLECIVLGWLYRIDNLRRHANERSDWQLGRWWNYAIRIFIPIVLGTLFFWSLFENLTAFASSTAWGFSTSNFVGFIVVAIIAPALAILLSCVRSRLGRDGEFSEDEDTETVIVRQGDKVALCLGIIAAVLVFIAFTERNATGPTFVCALSLSLIFSIIALILANSSIERNSASSPLVSAAGIIATLGISASFATVLVRVTSKVIESAAGDVVAGDKLSGTSYVILVVVFLLIVFGLGWCFFRAITAGAKDAPIQPADEKV